MTVESDGGYNPRFLGRTNLPSLMLLTVALESAAGEQLEEQQVTVQGGRFTTRPFAGYGVAHPPGRYVLRAIAAAPFLQPRRVRQLIGENGQLMTGPLVFEAPIGGRSVCLQQPVELEGAETV
ncbi:MAG: hypothetical protein JO264_01430 [Acidisphaera sp.]|nr:hypothetical protein [Acidisphaera sp.]